MHLLGISRIRLTRRNPRGDSLEGQLAEARLRADDHQDVDVLVDEFPAPDSRTPREREAPDSRWAALIWTRPLHAGIADYRFIEVLSAVSHGMSTLPLPERMPNDGEFVAVRVLFGASRTRQAPRATRDLQRSPVVCRLP